MYPYVDGALAAEVLEAVGASSDDDVENVVSALRSWIPAGSTAKWAAVDKGENPPGAHGATALEARLGGSFESWSCWAICTGVGGVLAAIGHDVRLAVEHRRGGGEVPLVDYHSVLIVDECLVDPFLGPSAPVTLGGEVTRREGWMSWVPGDRPDHLGVTGGGSLYRYRQLADRLDARDVKAFCAVSTTHSGVGRRRTAHWVRDGRVWFARDDATGEGQAELRRTVGDDPFQLNRSLVATGRFEDLVARIVE